MPFFLVLLLSAASAEAQKTFYRYINEQGNKVIDGVLPPSAARRGYEEVNATGDVLRVVVPTVQLTAEELAELEKQNILEADLDAWDASLRRRFGTVAQIQTAKARRLKDIEGSIAILEGNKKALRGQLDREILNAANMERRGAQPSEALKKAISTIELELDATDEHILGRKSQYDTVAAQYDRDIARFKEMPKQ